LHIATSLSDFSQRLFKTDAEPNILFFIAPGTAKANDGLCCAEI